MTVEVNSVPVGNAQLGYSRPDIERECPGYPNAANSGFLYLFQDQDFAQAAGGSAEIRLMFTTKCGESYIETISRPSTRTTEPTDEGLLRTYPLPLWLVQCFASISDDTTLLLQQWDERAEQE